MSEKHETYVIAYQNSQRPLAYYADDGFPWWAYDKESHATRYPSENIAEKHAKQLRKQRARAGKILVVPFAQRAKESGDE